MPYAAIEFQNPAGDVVQEVAVVRDRDHRARRTAGDAAPARPPSRRPGGWSARRAAGCPASAAGAGTGPRAVSRRRRGRESAYRPAGSAGRPSPSPDASRYPRRRDDRSSPASWPCRSRSWFIWSSDIGSANLSLISLYSLTRLTTACKPSSTTALTVLSGSSCGSCSRNPRVYPGASIGFAAELLVHARP